MPPRPRTSDDLPTAQVNLRAFLTPFGSVHHVEVEALAPDDTLIDVQLLAASGETRGELHRALSCWLERLTLALA